MYPESTGNILKKYQKRTQKVLRNYRGDKYDYRGGSQVLEMYWESIEKFQESAGKETERYREITGKVPAKNRQSTRKELKM